jgi:hypothetical protein
MQRISRLILTAAILATTLPLHAQLGLEGPPKEPVKNTDDPIKITKPTVDAKVQKITIPAAFWNQKMTSWVEVAVCGRPSDFLHETIVCIMVPKEQIMQAMRDAGFKDADAWVSNVRDFPRVRGDRAMILLEFERNGKKEVYSLDELLTYSGWGVSAGPHGWMFKGDPERAQNAKEPAPKPVAPGEEEADRTKILRDDPQVALVFKGIQHASRSFIDHPIAYDDWVYPMMRYSRNYRLLPNEVYDSNGEIKVTMTIQKVTEEQFLTEMAKTWHTEPFKEYMLKQMPTAKQIDKDKAELWALLPELKKLQKVPVETRDAIVETETFGKVSVLAASIEKGYATLDAAWAKWAAEHPVFEATENEELTELKQQAKLWREHMEHRQKRAEHLAIAEKAAFDLKQLEHKPQNDETKAQIQKLRGVELEARSSAVIADNVHPRAYWKHEQSRLDKNDPRTDWLRHINVQVELVEGKSETANAGLAYGRALQSGSASEVAAAQKVYALAVLKTSIAELKLRLADIEFEISKREGFEQELPDPELPAMKAQRKEIEDQLKAAQAATQPAAKP